MSCITSDGRAASGSASIPTPWKSCCRAATTAQKPGQCVMLPMIPGGQIGAPSCPLGTAAEPKPNSARARRASWRPRENSARRAGTAPGRASGASPGSR
jgi:hypothetical protein